MRPDHRDLQVDVVRRGRHRLDEPQHEVCERDEGLLLGPNEVAGGALDIFEHTLDLVVGSSDGRAGVGYDSRGTNENRRCKE